MRSTSKGGRDDAPDGRPVRELGALLLSREGRICSANGCRMLSARASSWAQVLSRRSPVTIRHLLLGLAAIGLNLLGCGTTPPTPTEAAAAPSSGKL